MQKIVKFIATIILSALFLSGFAACGSDNKSTTTPPQEEPITEPTQPQEEEPPLESAQLYELRVYDVEPGQMNASLAIFDEFFFDMFKDAGVTVVDFFVNFDESKIYYICAFDDAEAEEAAWDAFIGAFLENPELIEAYPEPLNRDITVMERPDLANFSPTPASGPVYELRIYDVEPGQMDTSLAIFDEFFFDMFKDAGVTVVDFFVNFDDNKIYYICAFESTEAEEAAWDAFIGAFLENPELIEAYPEPLNRDITVMERPDLINFSL